MGSSPLARGLLDQVDHALVRSGIIPARAGFTSSRGSNQPSMPDHPRSRGVYLHEVANLSVNAGSSPLARGLRKGTKAEVAAIGIIPARAGFTRGGPHTSPSRRDHPRSRGVYMRIVVVGAGELGSSPLARGLRGGWRRRISVPGIIPARAGFTRRAFRDYNVVADHPRSRGVYSAARRAMVNASGSSPLARGLPVRGRLSRSRLRIIPARAGFTWWDPEKSAEVGDHPRSRGVYIVCGQRSLRRGGSSPLARGLRSVLNVQEQRFRIIPARAGFTITPASGSFPQPDHPRSRGVYSAGAASGLAAGGSSPLARGLLNAAYQEAAANRIIPARAGFTP